jgi:hypothetical protein
MIGFMALIMGGLSLALIAMFAITLISLVVGFLAGGMSYLITGNAEVSKGWILLITLIVLILLIVWIL